MPKTIREFFESLNRSRAVYVVLRDWQDLPERWLDRDKPIRLLVDNVQDFMVIGGVTRIDGKYTCCINITVGGQEQRQLLEVYPKGAGLFPESFETQLLNKWEYQADMVRVPQQPYATYALMYLMMYVDKVQLPVDCQRSFEQFLRDRIGMNTSTSTTRPGKMLRKIRPRSVPG